MDPQRKILLKKKTWSLGFFRFSIMCFSDTVALFCWDSLQKLAHDPPTISSSTAIASFWFKRRPQGPCVWRQCWWKIKFSNPNCPVISWQSWGSWNSSPMENSLPTAPLLLASEWSAPAELSSTSRAIPGSNGGMVFHSSYKHPNEKGIAWGSLTWTVSSAWGESTCQIDPNWGVDRYVKHSNWSYAQENIGQMHWHKDLEVSESWGEHLVD